MDQLNATIGPATAATQALLSNAELTVDNTRTAVNQTDTAMDQVSAIVSEGVPNSLDQFSSSVPAIFESTESNVNATLALLEQFNFLPGTFRVETEAQSNQFSGNLDQVSAQLRALDPALNPDLSGVDQSLAAVSGDLNAINSQLDQVMVTLDSMQRVSDEFRKLDAVSDNNLAAVGEDVLALSEDVDLIQQQVELLVIVADNLGLIADQLRVLQAVSDNKGRLR
jgi:hypothetical protein